MPEGLKHKLLIVIDSNGGNGAIAALRWFVGWLVSTGKFEVTVFHLYYAGDIAGLPDAVRQTGYPKWVTRETIGIKTLLRLLVSPRLTLQQIALRLSNVYHGMSNRTLGLLCAHRVRYDTAISFTDDLTNRVIGGFNARRHYGWCHEDYSALGEMDVMRRGVRHYRKNMDAMFCVSNTACGALAKIIGSDSTDFLHVFHNLYPFNRKSRVHKDKRAVNAFVNIVSVGRLEPEKRFSWCIEAAVLLQQAGIEFVWTIIGDGSERQRLAEKIYECGLEKRVLLSGAVPNWRSNFSGESIYVQTSSQEGWGLALEEAAISGMAVICSDLPVFREVSDLIGVAFSYADSPKALARCIESQSSNNARRLDECRFDKILTAYDRDKANFLSVVMPNSHQAKERR